MNRETNPILIVDHLSKSFGRTRMWEKNPVNAVSDVSFTLERQSILAIVGESGSGKSTIARLIAGLLMPTLGQITVAGNVMPRRMTFRQKLKHRKDIQMIFQDPFSALNPHYSVRYHLERSLRNFGGSSPKERRERVCEALESVGLSPTSDYLEKKPHELSGGQRQRVVIAQALIVQPKVVLADEPTSMLDVSMRLGILNLMKKLRDELGLSYVFITHDLASARYISDHILVMYAGKIVEYGRTVDVIEHPAHPYTKVLLSAVPDPKKIRSGGQQRVMLKGEPPNLAHLPQGCYFHPRCPFVMPVCKEETPRVHQNDQGHWALCHLAESQEVSEHV